MPPEDTPSPTYMAKAKPFLLVPETDAQTHKLILEHTHKLHGDY